MSNRIVCFFLLTMFLLHSCTPMVFSDGVSDGGDILKEFESQVIFSVENLPIEAEIDTKVSYAHYPDLENGINVGCVHVNNNSESEYKDWGNCIFYKSGRYWAGGKSWNNYTNYTYRFYAVFPSLYDLTIFDGTNGTTIDARNTHDICVAYCSSGVYGIVNTLNFEHIFSRICSLSYEIDPEFESDYIFSDISVSVVPFTGGKYNLRYGTWDGLIAGNEVDLFNLEEDLLLVPGVYYLNVQWTVDGNGNHKICRSRLPITLEAGKIYNLNVNLTCPFSNYDALAEANCLNGVFTINAAGKKVRFSKGNLRAHIVSGPTDSYNFSADSWSFLTNQWDYCNSNLSVGSYVDHFGWVGSSAIYDTYGLSSMKDGGSSFNDYYGSTVGEALKTEWGRIPGVVSACGSGWFLLSEKEWEYLFKIRTTNGSVAGNENGRFALATIRTDVSSGRKGIILFPDGVSFAAGEFSSVGVINSYSSWLTRCTSAQWSALAAKGCVFLPASGQRSGTSKSNVDSYGYYWSRASSSNDYTCSRYVYFYSYGFLPASSSNRYYGYCVRLVRGVN